MDPFMARTMVETLSKGINPITGRALPLTDSCSIEEIQDALIEVLAHCSIESNEQYLLRLKEEKEALRKQKREETTKRYPRSREAWTKEEEMQLLSLYKKQYNIFRIANILKRTPGSISSRLKKISNKPVYREK